MKSCSPIEVDITIFDGLADIPPFNPDIEACNEPKVMALKNLLAESNGLFISSPEYAHGISGVLKNALDWLVSGEEFVCMPVAIFNTSPRASHAVRSLHEIIRTMSGNIIDEACITVPLLSSNLTPEGILNNNAMSESIRTAINAFLLETARKNEMAE